MEKNNIKPISTKEVELSVGKVTLRKPNAGARNKCTIAAEFSSPDSPSGSFIKWSIFWSELLPYAIADHPFDGSIPIRDALGGLSSTEYDKLQNELKTLYINELELQEAMQGESSGLSQAKPSQKENGSEISSSSSTSVPNSASAQTK